MEADVVTPLSFDFETELIRPACCAPRAVCLTWQVQGWDPQIKHWTEAEPFLRRWLTNPDVLLVGQNTAFDSAVICANWPHLTRLVFGAYGANRVTDTKLRAQLLDIAGGVFRGHLGDKGKWVVHNYDLSSLAKKHLGKTLDKDSWRLKYGELRDKPLDQWPEGARQYPLADADSTLGVYLAQEKHAEFLKDQFRQSYAAFALYISSAWGLRTNGPSVDSLKEQTEAALAELQDELVSAGLVRKDGSRDTKAAKRLMVQVCRANGLPLRRTPAHDKCEAGDSCKEHVSLDSDACEAIAGLDDVSDEGAELLGKYAELSTLTKVLSNDIAMLSQATEYPTHPRYDLAETGRTTCSKPNIQNLRRLPGIREAFIPRPGKVFAQADYPQLELYTLAQCCVSWLGESKLAEALNGGLDPHLAMAATILGISYDEAKANKKRKDVDNARQTAKVANFGFPGGLGIAKLVLFARKSYGVTLTHDQAKTLKEQWLATWPEMRRYFARVNAIFGEGVERASVETLFTERHRGGATYCAACNNGFQALGSDCAKRALCLVAEAEYCKPESPLYGARTTAFVHDEVIVECDEGRGHEAAFELARLMCEGANEYLKDVPIPLSKMEPTLMRVWSKEAKQVWKEGRLVPWTP